MEDIVLFEYRNLRNYHKYIYERYVGNVAYPYNPWEECDVPPCLSGPLKVWVESEIQQQYVEWDMERRADEKIRVKRMKMIVFVQGTK